MRRTIASLIPAVLAIVRVVQWVACAGVVRSVISTIVAIRSGDTGSRPGGRVASRSKPSTPFATYRCAHSRMRMRLRPRVRATCEGFARLISISTLRARCAVFCGVRPWATSASSWARSVLEPTKQYVG